MRPVDTMIPATPRLALAAMLTCALLAACGGGSDDSSAGTAGGTTGGTSGTPAATMPDCDTTKFVAGSVVAPTSAQMTAYAGTYNGDEGKYGPNPGDPFVKSASATFVMSASGAITYKGTAYTVKSICIDKAAGPVGTVMYVHTDKGHVDISDKVDPALGKAWGVSPADGATIFTNGQKA